MKIKQKWLRRYIANRRTKEIHRIGFAQPACSLMNLSKGNAIYCTWLWAWLLVKLRGYNGCRYCWPQMDKD